MKVPLIEPGMKVPLMLEPVEVELVDFLPHVRPPPPLPPSTTTTRPRLVPWDVVVLSGSFLACGIGVAIPWTALRTGVSYFKQQFSPDFYTRSFMLYYLCQAVILLLQERLDQHSDLRFGAQTTFPFRIIMGLSFLTLCLLALPFVSGNESAMYGLSAGIGALDAVVFGTASQLFGSIQLTAGGAYFMGSSLSSVLAIGLTFSTGFASLGYAGGGGGGTALPPLPLTLFYTGCAAMTLLALICMTALLCSKQGKAYLLRLDDSLLEISPNSPRAISRRPSQRFSPLEKWGVGWGDEEEEGSEEEGWEGGDSPRSSSPSRSHSSGGAKSSSAWAIFKATLPCQAAIFIIWAGTTAIDSLIAFMPSAGEHRGEGGAGQFTNYLLYASLGGELMGKNIMVFLGMRRKVVETKGVVEDEEGLLWSTSVLARMGLLGGSSSSSSAVDGGGSVWGGVGGGGGGDPQYQYVPIISSLKVLLGLCFLRTLLLPPYLFLLLQQVFGPARAGTLIPGFFYNDATTIILQCVFDGFGSFLSSLTYAILPTLVKIPGNRPKASALLAITLTMGTFFGLAISLTVSSFLPSNM